MVIGKTARYVSRNRRLIMYGYTIINDASARDLQFVSSQWATGKIGDTLAPVGPYIADTTEIPDPHGLDLKTWVNGTLMQNGNTRNFIFDVRYLVSYLSQLMTLLPGDLIATGTPAGVGFPQATHHAAARRHRAPGDHWPGQTRKYYQRRLIAPLPVERVTATPVKNFREEEYMQAVAFTQTGEPNVLQVMDVPDPTAGPGQVRIRVSVSGVNFRDVGVRRHGRNEGSRVPEPVVTGIEAAGVVESLGTGVTHQSGTAGGDYLPGWRLWRFTGGAGSAGRAAAG